MPNNNIPSVSDALAFEEHIDFSGGQMYSSDIAKVGAANQSYNKNMDFDGVDGLVTRAGSTGLVSLAGSASLVHYWDEIVPTLVAFSGTTVQEWDGSSLSTLTGYTPAGEVNAIRAGDKVYAVDGVSALYYYDGAAWAANIAPAVKPAPVGCSLICQVANQGRMALTGKADEPGRIFYSDIHLNNVPEFDQTTWSIDNGNDGLPNTAQAGWYGFYHVVWKRNSTVVIDCVADATSADGFTKKTVSETIGCIAPRTARAVKGRQMFFLSEDGLRVLFPSDSDLGFDISDPLTDKIKNWWNRVNRSYLNKAHALFRGTKYILWLPLDGATSCTHAFVWDTRLNDGAGGWVGIWEGWDSSDMVLADLDGITKLYYASNAGRLCEWLDWVDDDGVSATTMKDDGVDIESFTETGGFSLNERFNDKRFHMAEIIYKLDNTSQSGVLSSSVGGSEYDDVAVLAPSMGLSLPLSLPFTLPVASNKVRPVSLVSGDEGRCISLRAKATSGRLRLSSIWVAGFVKGLRKDNSN